VALIVVVGAICIHPIQVNAGDATLVVLAAGRFHDLTMAERRMLEYADIGNEKRGDWAFCGISTNPADPSNDPKNAATWKHERDIRASMIRWLADSKARARVDPKGVRVFGARIVGPLDLSDTHVPFAIALVQCSIPERMNLDSTSIPFFDVAGSRIGEIYGPDMIVEGDLDIGYDNNNQFLDTWASGEVYLAELKVGGNASFGGGHFVHSKVEPLGWGAELKRALDVNKSEIKGSLVICCGVESHGAVLVFGAKVGSLDLWASHLINPNNVALAATNVSVDRDVAIGVVDRDVPEFDGELNFVSARVGANFVVDHARFRGKAGEKHGFVADGLAVGNGFTWHDVTLENGAVLDLRGAVVGGLLDQERSWPSPGKLLIDGFTYKGFGPESPSDVASRLKWLRLQPGFRPQPYRQLANVLLANGDEAGAALVLAAKDDAQSESSSAGKFFPNGTNRMRRIAEVVLPIVMFIAASLIFAQVYYTRRVGIAAGEGAHRHSPRQMGSETNSSDGVDRASQRVASDAPPAGAAGQNIFRREGEFWTIAYGGITVRLKDTKGLGYIACLLEHPGEEIHVHDLIAIVEGIPAGQISGEQTASGQTRGLEIVSDLGDAGEMLDFRARADYHRRLLEVREELGEAQRQNDTGRAEAARSELEFLHAELSAAIGHGGHGRKTSAHAERARLLVGKNIRAALDKIQRQDRTLGHYFAASIRTGYFCAYIPAPDNKILWQL
jgi:hypothetical protein